MVGVGFHVKETFQNYCHFKEFVANLIKANNNSHGGEEKEGG